MVPKNKMDEKYKVNYGSELKGVAKGLGFMLFIVILIYSIPNLNFYSRFGIIMLAVAVMQRFQKKLNNKKDILGLGKTAVVILVIMGLFKAFGAYGFLGYLVVCILLAIYIIYQRKDKFIHMKHTIEAMIWGKPLKDFIEKGEKPPKLKIDLSSKKQKQ
jgi:hypothetical protein